MIELTITIKDEDLKISENHLIYDPITLSPNDATLTSLVNDLMDRFKVHKQRLVDPEVVLKARMIL